LLLLPWFFLVAPSVLALNISALKQNIFIVSINYFYFIAKSLPVIAVVSDSIGESCNNSYQTADFVHNQLVIFQIRSAKFHVSAAT